MTTSDSHIIIDHHELERDTLERRLLAAPDERVSGKGRSSWFFRVGTAVLLLLAMAQTLYLYRDQAVAMEFIASASKSFGFTPPQIHRPGMIGLTNRVFTHVEREAGLYRLQLTLINHASHPLPFPLIEVSLTDARGEIQARNRFHAGDYLPSSVARSQIAPEEEHAVSFFMKSSVTDASGFILDFF